MCSFHQTCNLVEIVDSKGFKLVANLVLLVYNQTMEPNLIRPHSSAADMLAEELRPEIEQLQRAARRCVGVKWNEARTIRDMPTGVVGVYAVFDGKNGKLLYVGSGTVYGRVREWLSKRFNGRVKWRMARRLGEHLMAEYRLIWKLQPPLNKKGIYKERQRPIASRLTGKQVRMISDEMMKKTEQLAAKLNANKGRSQKIDDLVELEKTDKDILAAMEEFVAEIDQRSKESAQE